MTTNSNNRLRPWGFLFLGGGLLLGLPITASYAVQYVDLAPPAVPAPPAPPAPPKPMASMPTPPVPPTPPAAAAKLAGLAQGTSTISVGHGDISFIGTDTVRINGVTKRWEELTPAERSRIRSDTAKAREQLNRELADLPQRMASLRSDLERFRNGQFEREMAEARSNLSRSIIDIEKQAKILRANGQDPEKIQAEMRRSLAEIAPEKMAETARKAIVDIDPARIQADLDNARRSLDEIEVKLNRLDRR